MSANVAATQPPANANGQHGEGWRNRGRDRYRPHKHKGGQKSHPDILIPTKLASIILSLSLKELAPEENMLMGIDSLSARIQEEYMAILKEGGVELLNACQQDDNSSVYSRSLSPVKKETAGKVGLSGPGDDEGYPQSSLPTPAPEVDSPLVPNALDANTKPTISKKFEPTDLLDNVYLRRVIASCILPVALASADGKVEYYELDVVEDRKRRNYPWLAQAVKATDSAMKAIDTLPDFVKLAIPKVITPQMLKSHKLEGSLDEMVAELNKALEERRTEVKSRRAAAEAKFQQSRKLANLERLRVHDQDPPPPLFLSQAFISVVTQSASTLLKILEQPPGFLQTRYEFLKKLQNIINRSYHGAGVKAHLFGSSVTGLGNIGSDVDVTLEVPGTGNPQDHPISNMYNLGKILRAAGMVKVTVIAHARVPICKFVDPFLKLSCDVNVGNMLGIQNSKLISTYLSLDPRVHPLIMLIKHWAKAREINNPSGGGTLSSYAYALMVINFLQIRGFLPSLQELYSAPERKWLTTRVQERPRIKNRKFNHYRFKDNDKARKTKNSENSQDLETAGETAAASSKEKEIEAESAFIETVQGMVTWDISYVDNLDHPDLKEYPRITADGLGPTVIMLFYGFMHYYGWDYEYRPDRVVSVRKGTVLDYVPTPLKRDKVLDAALIVEDPFQLDRNTTGMVEEIPPVLNEFRRAARILANSSIQYTEDGNLENVDQSWRTIFEKSSRLKGESEDASKSDRPRAIMNEGHEDRPARQEGGNGKDKKKRSLSRSRAGKMSTPVLSLNPPQASQGKPSKSVDTVMLGTTEPKMQPAKNTANRNAKSFGNIPQVASAATEPSPKQSLQRRSSLRSDRSLERNAGGMRSTSPSFQQLSAIQETGVPLSPKTVRRPSMPTEVKEDFSISTSSVDLNISITRHVKSTPNLKNQAKTDGRKASSGGPTRNHSVRQASAGSSTDSVSPPSRARDAWGNAPVPIRRRSQDRGATTPGRRPSYDGAAIPATVPEVARSGKPGYGKKAADKIPYGLKQDGLSQSLTHPPDRIKEPWVDDKVDVASIGSAEALLPNENHPAEKLKDFVPKKVRSDPKQRNRGGNL